MSRRCVISTFGRLWVGNSVAFVGFHLTAVAVPVQVYELTGSSFWVGMLGAVGFVPLVIFGLWGGAVADAVDRRRLLMVSCAVLWACTGVLFVHALLGSTVWRCCWASWPYRQPASLRHHRLAVRSSRDCFPWSSSRLQHTCRSPPATSAWSLAHYWQRSCSRAGRSRWCTQSMLRCSACVVCSATPARAAASGTTVPPGLRSVLDGLAFIATRPVLLMSFVVDILAMVLAMPRAVPRAGRAARR